MSAKHDANIKQGKLLKFQIGLIALLCFTYIMHEVMSYRPIKEINKPEKIAFVDDEPVMIPIGTIEVVPNIPVETPKSDASKNRDTPKTIEVTQPEDTTPEVVDNSVEVKQPKITEPTEAPTTTNSNPTNAKPTFENPTSGNVGKKVSGRAVSHKVVKYLPIFPGCDRYSTNNERAKCFQEKVQKLVLRKFDNGLGEELGLEGRQQIFLYFEIDENGRVSNIKARSKTPQLADEAVRVAKLLPTMKPANDGTRNVKMFYNLPITFSVR